jgi:hypothetical protein
VTKSINTPADIGVRANYTTTGRWTVVRCGELMLLGAFATKTSSEGEIFGLNGNTYK